MEVILLERVEKLGANGQELVERIQEPLTEEVMRELNSRVSLDKEEPEAVAKQYLTESGFIESGA